MRRMFGCHPPPPPSQKTSKQARGPTRFKKPDFHTPTFLNLFLTPQDRNALSPTFWAPPKTEIEGDSIPCHFEKRMC